MVLVSDLAGNLAKAHVSHCSRHLINIIMATLESNVALGLSNQQAEVAERSVETLQFLHNVEQLEECERPAVPTTEEQIKYLGKFR